MLISDIVKAAREKREKIEAERRKKYLESLSEDDREDVLAREGNRERKRERKEAEEPEEVFPWEK